MSNLDRTHGQLISHVNNRNSIRHMGAGGKDSAADSGEMYHYQVQYH